MRFRRANTVSDRENGCTDRHTPTPDGKIVDRIRRPLRYHRAPAAHQQLMQRSSARYRCAVLGTHQRAKQLRSDTAANKTTLFKKAARTLERAVGIGKRLRRLRDKSARRVCEPL